MLIIQMRAIQYKLGNVLAIRMKKTDREQLQKNWG